MVRKMPIISGKEYIERINALQTNLWMDGEKIKGKISEHPAFEGIINSQAKLYDLQCDPTKSDLMTFTSGTTGNKIGTSFLEPKTKEDLEKRRLMTQEWAKVSAGMMGRSPDYMNTVLMTFATASDILSEQEKRFTKNMQQLFEDAKENDWCFTHTFINPQKNRAVLQSFFDEDKDQIIAAQTMEENSDGIVIQGARLLATQGGITDEILVFPAPSGAFNEKHAYGFSIPSNTPGLKFISRESFRYRPSSFDHPLGSRFDEVDTVVVFDHVTVPWERVFFYKNSEIAYKIYNESSYNPLTAHQVLSRRIIKIEFILGLTQVLISTINVGEYQHIHEKVSDIIIGLESLKALLLTSELQATIDKWGTMVPNSTQLDVATNLFPKLYGRCMEVLQQIGASGLVAIPTENDFSSPLRSDLDIYLQGAAENAENRVKIFRLAWDTSMSAFGTRQALYERFFFGDPVRLASKLYSIYNREDEIKHVRQFLQLDNKE